MPLVLLFLLLNVLLVSSLLLYQTSQGCSSECESEGEDMEVEGLEEGEIAKEEEDEEEREEEEQESQSSQVFLPRETLDRKESVELWKSRYSTAN